MTTSPPPATQAGTTDHLDDRLVGDLVTEDPRRAAVFERLGIDYCCGGRVPLSAACADHGLDVATVRGLLADAVSDGDEERDWSSAPVDELVSHIVSRHHGYLRDELPRVLVLAHKVARAHGNSDPRLVRAEAVVTRLADEMRAHITQEEAHVFPAMQHVVEQTPAGEDLHPIDTLAAEVGGLVDDHAETAAHFAMLRVLLDEFVPGDHACTSWRAYLDALERLERDTHRHVHLENHVLFPMVMERLYAAADPTDG